MTSRARPRTISETATRPAAQDARSQAAELARLDLSLSAPPTLSARATRKYQAMVLDASGEIRATTQIAPAVPLFEHTASAMARGTLMPTPMGPVAIEDLLPGDLVVTTTGPQTVVWIGATTYVPGVDEPASGLLHLTRAVAQGPELGPRGPMDLLLGPGARSVLRHPRLTRLVGQDWAMLPVCDAIDGDRFVQVTPGGAVMLYHLMLAEHALIPLSGLEIESYHPGKALRYLTTEPQRSLFLSLFPHIRDLTEFPPMRLPRATREVLDSLSDT